MIHIRVILFVFICLIANTIIQAQGPAYIVAGGPTLSNQKVSGFSREPFIRYHGYVSIESTSEISPNSLYARLGYHVKGSAVNIHNFYDIDGNSFEGASYAMEFNNASFSLGIKQRKELGNKHYYYGFGIRGDYNVGTNFGLIFKGLEGAQNKFTYGVDVDLGLELPLSDLISVIFEIGISPDFADQMFIPPQLTGYRYPDGSPVIIPETKLRNVVIEARAGFRFWNKIIYTD
ncbi:MAG TPA: hypothetical protein VMZ69_10960 [Saprospiraceae bacterium]|nr:hypothetical protein [Saprospiraceae bacterium]